MICQTCGAFNAPGAKFCQDCGKNISGSVAAAAPVPGAAIRVPADAAKDGDFTRAVQSAQAAPAYSQDNPGPIWNPNAAASWSLVFTPAFGAYLHMLNWKALGHEDKAATARTWVYISLVMLLVYLIPALVLPDSKAVDGALRGIGFAYLLTWYFAGAKEQIKYVKERFGKNYVRRPWAKALGLGVLSIFGYFVAALVIGFVWGLIKYFIIK